MYEGSGTYASVQAQPFSRSRASAFASSLELEYRSSSFHQLSAQVVALAV
jgi:hypothetical protein